ncbi:MAG: hypothetical protein VE99_C0003G0053 [candidate division Kazan bacterium GW2011_GWC1_52_13]|uniref:Uncharacterized protein n=1 Tax=candidate division Kazan bacterium GW2011_GWB1_52_7 TaxID=1620414 RepID=A0A0G1X4W9_UNCK3|nr:MAG: hypothetical protein VE99_C0003G0053 [candidate division Kazan bacterium GW2011_GWC1_52_13]KKW26173.1 MAG: hypothetical protein VF00_C0016G0011 [candidate division Kazan bacterium GW2011_GWB1_52_7]
MHKNELFLLLVVLTAGLSIAVLFVSGAMSDEAVISAEPTKATVTLDWNPVDPLRPGLTCLGSELGLSNGYSLYLTYCGPAE